MTNQAFIAALLLFAIVNGIFSPATAMVFMLHPLWYPPIAPFVLPVAFLVASLIVSTATIMLAGVAAAVYEHAAGRRGGGDLVSAWIWLSATALLSAPAVIRALQLV